MAPIKTFIRWLKGKSKDGHQAKIARLRKLPPIPPESAYEYGFRVSDRSDNIQETHVYEEIPYEDTEDVNKESTIADTIQKLDFSSAKTVGPYLVVPIRKGEISSVEEYRSLYSMFPEWAKHQLKDENRKRQGLAISRGYSVDPPNNLSNELSDKCRKNSTPTILEKSLDSGNSSDSDSDGYLRSHGGSSRSSHGDSRTSGISSSESLSDLDVFADELDDDFDYFIVEDTRNCRNDNVSMTTADISLTTVSSLDTASPSKDLRRPKHDKQLSDTKSARYKFEAEALIDQLYQSRIPEMPVRENQKSDKSTGLSSTPLRSRDDSACARMSCRTSGFQMDYRRRSMDVRTKSRNSSTSSSADSDYGSIYGPSHGLHSHHNRFLGDMIKRNYDRQFMIPRL